MKNAKLDISGVTVEVVPHLTFAANAEIEGSRVRMYRDPDSERIEVIQTPLEHAVAVITQCVVDWDLADHAGKPVALTHAGISAAPAAAVADIVDAVEGHYAGPKESTQI